MAQTLNWGILGAGGIAKAFAKGVLASQYGKLVAVGSRTVEKANEFADEFSVPNRHGSYEALLADKQVQAIYIATPHPMHAEWAIKCAEAGKHILCEKPLTLNHAEAMVVVEAARRNNVFLMEAFMYRCHPQIAKLVELLREKAIGDVRVIQATFSFQAGFDPKGRLFAQELGGGGILDVGCYTTSMCGLIAGIANGKDYCEPLELKALGKIGESRVDDYTCAVAKYPGDIIAQLATGVLVNQDSSVRIYGSEGMIHIPQPWIPARDGGAVEMYVQKKGDKQAQKLVIETPDKLYALEADTVAENLDKREAAFPAMTINSTLGNMKTLDMWREAIGLVYDMEKAEAQTLPVSKRPLSVRKDARMKYGKVPGLNKQMSRLIMGVDNQRTIAHASAMFDDWIERGGNAFDTAWLYGAGLHEKLLGQWMKNRNIREQVVLLDKGAHTPLCNPKSLTEQFLQSLDRLQTGYVDIYMLHRDNLDVPAGEFIDVLNEHVRAGRMKVFGASNWSIERVEAANEYARKKGLQGMTAISNNFSLAQMVEAPWAGCISASDAKSRAWLAKNQFTLMPWSSQAQGFFTDRANPKETNTPLAKCWYSQDNWQRRQRAQELAKKRNCELVNIALAYVLHQPFPTFPLIGPRLISETRSSLQALEIELTPQEVKWLNLED